MLILCGTKTLQVSEHLLGMNSTTWEYVFEQPSIWKSNPEKQQFTVDSSAKMGTLPLSPSQWPLANHFYCIFHLLYNLFFKPPLFTYNRIIEKVTCLIVNMLINCRCLTETTILQQNYDMNLFSECFAHANYCTCTCMCWRDVQALTKLGLIMLQFIDCQCT